MINSDAIVATIVLEGVNVVYAIVNIIDAKRHPTISYPLELYCFPVRRKEGEAVKSLRNIFPICVNVSYHELSRFPMNLNVTMCLIPLCSTWICINETPRKNSSPE